jgi:hypothetical protein
MILKSIILLISYLQILGFGYFFNNLFSLNFRDLSKIFLLGFIFQSIILQIHYIFFPINFKFTFIQTIISISFFLFFYKISFGKFIRYFRDKKLISTFFILIFILSQSTSLEYPTNFSIPDFYLYHKNFVDWANNYPVIEGLALLNPRHGYAGTTYLNAAYYNFYPFFNNGWSILTPLFILFFQILFFQIIIKVSKYPKNSLKIYNIYLLLSSYLILKIIMIISKADISHFLIFTIISIYLFYLLLRLTNNFNIADAKIILITAIFLPTTLFSISIYSFLLIIVVLFYLVKNDKFFEIDKTSIVIIFVFSIVPMFYLNYIKTGYFFYPANFIENFFNFQKPWSVKPETGMNLIKGAGDYNWAKEKNLKIALITNWPPFFLSLILTPFFIFILSFYKDFRKYFLLFFLCIFLIIIWYLSAPEQRYGTPFIWPYFIFELSIFLLLILKSNFFENKKTILIIVILFLNLSQIIRYYDDVKFNLNFKYLDDNFIEYYNLQKKDDITFVVSDDNGLLIYNGDNKFVTENIDGFKFLKNKDTYSFIRTDND